MTSNTSASAIPTDLLELALGTAEVGVAVINSAHQFAQVTSVFAQMLGYEAADLVEQPWTMVAPRNILNTADSLLADLLFGTAKGPFDWELVHRNRGPVLTRVHFKDIKNVDGDVSILMTITGHAAHFRAPSSVQKTAPTFIGGSSTEHDAAHNQLLELDASGDAVLTLTLVGSIRSWSKRAEKLFGWFATETLNKPLSDLIIAPKSRTAYDAFLLDFVANTPTSLAEQHLHLTAVHRDGRDIPVNLTLKPIKIGERILLGMVFRDMSVHNSTETLLQSEQRYRYMIEHVSEGVLVVQAGRIVFANPRALLTLGRSLEELRSVPFTESVYPADRALVAENYHRRVRGEQLDKTYVFRVVQPNGVVTWVQLSAVAINWEGEPATLSFIADVNERVQLEIRLKQSLSERETILQSSILGIAFLNEKGRIHWANEALEQILGKLKKLENSESLEQYYPSREHYLRVGAAAAKATYEGHAFETELQLKRPDGSLFWAYLSGRSVEAGNLSKGTVWVVMDITARRQLEDDLRRKTAEQEAILKSTVVGITSSNPEVHTWVNDTFAQMLGYNPSDLIGHPPVKHFPSQESWEDLMAKAYPILRSGQAFTTECQMRRRDGSLIWVLVHGKRVDAERRKPGTIWTFVDVTERKRSDEMLKDALAKQTELTRLKSRFISMTSHEFRTPLATILSSAEIIEHYHAKLTAQERQDLTGSIQTAVTRMTAMLDDVLMIGKIDADKLEFNPQPMMLEHICKQIADENRVIAAAQKEKVDIELMLSACDVQVQLDEKLLRHILGNLLSNAVKYSPDGGKVFFGAVCRTKEIEFIVADTGIGLPKEDIPQLFDTFYRASNVGNISGTGLGLAIVRRAVDLHKGTIKVDSALGSGTRFTVNLPRL